MYMTTGRPFIGHALENLKRFLVRCGLDYDAGVGYTAALVEDGEIIATGSLDGATIKCVAVAPEHQGEDLCARILTQLRGEAFERGITQLTLFTKPANEAMFAAFGFYPLARTADCLLMENSRDGLERYLANIPSPAAGTVGCIVANCNPFTLGHRYLIQTAASMCDYLHVFILSEDRGILPPETRLRVARARPCDATPQNAAFHPTGICLGIRRHLSGLFHTATRRAAAASILRTGSEAVCRARRIAPALRHFQTLCGYGAIQRDHPRL